jgi:RNA polymerase sigma factor (sigma-70 family)
MTHRFTRMYRGLLSEDDVAQWVQMGVTEAARTYREDHGTPFGHVAYKRVTGLIVEAAKQETRERRLARQAAEACMAGQTDPATPMDTEDDTARQMHQLCNRVVAAMLLATEGSVAMAAGEDEVADRQERSIVTQRLHDAMRALPDQERHILHRHYFEEQEL